jgi:hypothetical protein
MKKHLLTITLAVSVCFYASAQKQSRRINRFSESTAKTQIAPPSNVYSFSTFTAPYQPITGTSVTNGLKWDDAIHSIPLGFTFSLYNSTGSTINLLGGYTFSFDDFENASIFTEGGPIWEDLCDRSYDPAIDTEGDPGGTSTISYTTTGAPGSRICVIQLSNVGFYGENDANGTSDSYINLQIWLYEGTNDIEFRYGNIDIQNPALNLANGTSGFICGLFDQIDYLNNQIAGSNLLNGPHNSPTMVALGSNFSEVVSGAIQSGRVYKFTRAVATGIKPITNLAKVNVFPNPAKNLIQLSGNFTEQNTVVIYDLSGKKVKETTASSEISVSELENGVYMLHLIENGKKVYSGKLLIAE